MLVTCSHQQLWAERFNAGTQHPAPNQLITSLEAIKERYDTRCPLPEPGELVIDTVNPLPLLAEQVRCFVGIS